MSEIRQKQPRFISNIVDTQRLRIDEGSDLELSKDYI